MYKNVSEVIVRYLEDKNITTVFGYPGGVCIATSGPGATNLITSIATAYMDSIPIVIITGQVKSTLIGTDAFQEADITGATLPFTKHNYLVRQADDMARIIHAAFHIASTGRPGPVLIDIPSDILADNTKVPYPRAVDIPGYKPTTNGHVGQIKRPISKLKNSTKPLIFTGGGIISANAIDDLRTFAEKNHIPVVNSYMGLGSFDAESPLYCGLVGSHGHKYANDLFACADLIIVMGARLSNRTMHRLQTLNFEVEIIHIDPAEIGKNLLTSIPLVGDAKLILKTLNSSTLHLKHHVWIEKIKADKSMVNLEVDHNLGLVSPKRFVRELSAKLSSTSTLVADVGQNQFWAARNYSLKNGRKFMTSGGLGTMGYFLPAAIGAKLASKNSQVICTLVDGSIQLCLGELAVVAELKLGIKIIIFKNNRLGMVGELQDSAYGKHKNFGVNFNLDVDFVQVAKAYGI